MRSILLCIFRNQASVKRKNPPYEQNIKWPWNRVSALPSEDWKRKRWPVFRYGSTARLGPRRQKRGIEGELTMAYAVDSLRRDFPLLGTRVHGHALVYLNNAATTQVPQRVIDAISEQMSRHEANVHRGIHSLSERSTARLEAARERVRAFIEARESSEIVFTAGTTASVNLLARSWCDANLHPGDAVIVSQMEHHSNFLPWQEAARRKGADFRVAPLDEKGDLDLEALSRLLDGKVKILAVCGVSNVLGTVNPLEEIVSLAHHAGALVFVDGAQTMRHFPVDVQALDCDFLAFSAHKMIGPTGVGILYGKRELLEELQPVDFGGGMVAYADNDSARFDDVPFRFEAGTPNIVGDIAFAEAIDYLEGGPKADPSFFTSAAAHELELLKAIEGHIASLPGTHILGKPNRRAGVVSFTVDGAHPFDIATLLDQLGIAVRSGHHCAIPLLGSLGIETAVRVSPAFYNSFEEVEALASALERVLHLLDGRRS